MDREIYSPLDASSWVTIDLYALRRYNSAFIEVTELKLNVQLNRSEKFWRDFQKSRGERNPYLSAVLLSRVWIQVYFAPIDEDKMEAFLKHSKVQMLHILLNPFLFMSFCSGCRNCEKLRIQMNMRWFLINVFQYLKKLELRWTAVTGAVRIATAKMFCQPPQFPSLWT